LGSLACSPICVHALDAISASSGQSKPIFEQWSLIKLDGKRCGFDSTITTRVETPSGPGYQTTEEEEFVVRRMGDHVKIIDSSRITEDGDGGVLSFDQTIKGNGSEVRSTGHREGDYLIVSSRGQTQRYHVPRLAALGPEAVRRLCHALPLRAGQTFSFPTFASDFPQGTVLDQGKVAGQETRTIAGRDRRLWRISSLSSLTPSLKTASWVDDRGNEVETILNIPGIGSLDEIASTREECMKQPEGAEIFASSLLHPQRALPDPKSLVEATYRIISRDPSSHLVLWNEGEQHVLSSQPGEVEVAVTAPDILPSDADWSLPHADTPELHRFLQPSAYLESGSPEIIKLSREAVGNEKNPVIAARRIEQFVRAYITKKDLNIGFATAEETARSREGDCTEHAVLCAALGRAAGIPTRCVLGFGYVPPGMDEPTITYLVDRDTGTFGFHMWAEAWIGPDHWFAMDAALDGFDVGHIAITKSALEEIDPLADLDLPIVQLMQNLKITILHAVPKGSSHSSTIP
jgi:hypothetical protein